MQNESLESRNDNNELMENNDNEISFKTVSEDAEDNLEMLNSSQLMSNNIANVSLKMLDEKKKELDNVYGVRKLSKGKLMIGESPINFEQNDVMIVNLSYPATKGLFELLFKKIPEENYISIVDRENYKNILLQKMHIKSIIKLMELFVRIKV